MEGDRNRLRRPVTEADWTRGSTEALVTLVEYVDFQCPCCRGSYPVVEGLLEESGDRVRYVVRYFPVASIHPYAEGAARAAEAAGRQDKFWPMYHRLLQGRVRLSPADLDFHARELRLEMDRFHADLESEAVIARITEDKYWGLRSGVNGTPTLFVNGERYEEAVCPVEEGGLREAVGAGIEHRESRIGSSRE